MPSRAWFPPRQIRRKHSGMGFRKIGAYFGGRDHTTVLHAFHKIEACLESNERIRRAVADIQSLILN